MSTRGIDVAGTHLEIRRARPEDLDALISFYDRLDPVDVHRRFFTGGRPDAPFVASWIAQNDQGGVVLVVVEGDDIIAEAGVALDSRGDGELAVAIDSRWRGWLGPFLVDLVLGAAGDLGITAVVVDTLARNSAMLALVRARGGVIEPTPDPTCVRAVLGTHRRLPEWPRRSHRPHVLVEGSRYRREDLFDQVRAGATVLVCGGPEARGAPGCPLLAGEMCPLAEDADVVILAFDPDDDTATRLAEIHRRAGRGVIESRESSRRADGSDDAAQDPRAAAT